MLFSSTIRTGFTVSARKRITPSSPTATRSEANSLTTVSFV